MNKCTFLSYLVFASTILYSCKPLKTLVNNEFPPLSTTDQQYVSVERNIARIEALKPHIGIHIDKGIILEYLPAEIKKATEAVKIESIIVQKLEPKLSFEKQGIFIDADFEINIPEQKAEIRGRFIGVTAVSTGADSLFLRSALSSVKIKKIKFTKKPGFSRRALASSITPILKNYIENINGQIFKKPTVIYTGWGETYKLNLKEMFKDPNTTVTADTIKVSRYTKRNSIRIGTNGISIIAELSKTEDVKDTLSNITNQPRTDSELTRIFSNYSNKFDNCWLTVFEPINEKASIIANISKQEISNILNEGLSKPIILNQIFSIPEATFNEKLEVKRGDIDCQKVRTKFEYPDFNGDRCDWDCMHTVTIGICPLCRRERVEDPICAASRRACKLRVEAERIAWQAARETARIAHQVENEAKVAACNVQRQAMDFMALGRFKGNVSGSGKAVINLNSFSFKNDLTEIGINYSGNVDAKLKANLELNPVDLGYIFFCFSDYSKRISSDINLNIPEATSTILINSSRDGDNLNLNIKLDKVSYDASINPSPLHSLLLDPQFAVQCPISTLIGLVSISVAVGKFLGMVKLAPEQELLLLGKVKGKYGVDEMQIPFKPISFKINKGDEKKSLIFWNSKSIQFAYLKP